MHARRSQSGFSLVEMLLVVSIIGLLAALAIPTWARMVAKTHQSEAKTNLATVATLERGFHQEFARYGDFSEINFNVDPDSRYLYCLGSWTGAGAGGGGIGGVPGVMGVPPASGSGGGAGGGGTGGVPNTPSGGGGSTVGGGGAKGGVGGVQIQSVPPGGGSAVFVKLDRELLGLTRGSHALLAILAPPALPATAPLASTSPCGGNAHFDESTFEADAAGQISDAPPPNDVDVWSIDESAALMNINRGF